MRPVSRRARQRPIRRLLALIFIVPLVSLLVLWGFAASVTVSNAVQEHNFSTENKLYGGAAQVLGADLAQERMQAFDWLSGGAHAAAEQPMLAAFTATDAAFSSFRSGVNAAPGMIQASTRPALRAFENALGTLPNLRAQIQAGLMTPLGAFNAYNAIIDTQFRLYGGLVVVDNNALYRQAAASVEAGRGLELADREITLVSGALAAGGAMSTAERIQFAQDVASEKLLMSDALGVLDPSVGSGYAQANSSQAYRNFAAIQNQIIASIGAKGPIPVSGLEFAVATLPLFKKYQAAEAQDRVALTEQGTRVGNRLLLEVGLTGGLGLVAFALSLFLMLRFGRRINRELTGLQTAALELAQDRLPNVMSKLSRGEEIDTATEAVPLTDGRISETAQVAEAFASVQRTAVDAAVGQAKLRRGLSQVFQNLAWRSQSLLHRQLALLDAMERKTSDPETLDELFQLDHLTTRMRRHAEGLIILSGSAPGRGWREPVPVMDVLRAAVAEVEDYKRVTVLCDSQDAVIGTAVADVIHLLAELIENATTYSPASTEVMVRAERVANGFAVEIEDRGIGFGRDEMAVFNERLTSAPEFDIANSDQLGLFVVGRLAAKHNVRVTLRSSPYGGTTAIALLPHGIVSVTELTIEGESFDVFRPQPGVHAMETAADRAPGGSVAIGRLAPYVRTEGDDPWHGNPVWDTAPPVAADADITDQAREDVGAGPGGRSSAGTDTASPAGTGSPVGTVPAADTVPAAGIAPAAGTGGRVGHRLDLGRISADRAGTSPVTPRPVAPAPASPEPNGSAASAAPALPRRVRQASLAPQLRDQPAETASEATDDASAGLSPADSRALVESLQFGLDLARATPTPDDAWPPTVEGSDHPADHDDPEAQ